MLPIFAVGLAMDLDPALSQLASPSTWCAGATVLATSRDPRALAALVDAYGLPVETSKLCLLDAMEQLGKDGAVEALLASDPPRALVAMSLVADPRWLPLLEARVGDPTTRDAAADALRLQRRDAAWEATCIRLLSDPSPEVRAAAARLLAGRTSTRGAVEARLTVETDPTVSALLAAALGR